MENPTTGSSGALGGTSRELVLRTARLELVACSASAARASLLGRRPLERLLERPVPATWPPADLHDALALRAALPSDGGSLAGWGLWLALLDAPDGSLVGSAGFKGSPDDSATVEIGYGIEPPFRRRGLATEAVRALVEWAFHCGARRVVAECHPVNEGSVGVLRRAGMRPLEPRAGMLWWELTTPW